MVKILEAVRGASKHSERIYKICNILAVVAKELVNSQQAPLGTYSAQDDSLQLSDYVDPTSVIERRDLQDSESFDMSEFLHDWEEQGVGGILAGWLNGESTSLDMV